MVDDRVKKILTEFDLALPPQPLADLALVPPESGPAGDRRIDTGRDLLIFVGRWICALKSRFIWLHSRVRSPRLPPPIGTMSSRRMNPESEEPRTSSRDWVRTASVHSQASKRRGRLPKGSLLALLENMMSVNGPLTRLYSLAREYQRNEESG